MEKEEFAPDVTKEGEMNTKKESVFSRDLQFILCRNKFVYATRAEYLLF